MAAIWLSVKDLVKATSFQTVTACTQDDESTNAPDLDVVNDLIGYGEAEVLSWLVPEYGPAPLSSQLLTEFAGDTFLKLCAIDFTIARMYDRRPEWVRANRSDSTESRTKDATARMGRVLSARQRAPTVTTPPANVGGAVVDGGNRLYSPEPDGTSNAGDYVTCEWDALAELKLHRRWQFGP